jgi:soluble lytic murein transglycosylase-like protein
MGGPRVAREGTTAAASGLAGAPYRQLIDEISGRHGVDPQLTEAVIEVESSFNPNAVSPMGALGLMQLIPATGERFGVSNFFDPADNIRGGVQFLSFLIDKFRGNPDLVLAAYNSGENRVEQLGRVPAIPETENYIRKVRLAWERLRGSSTADMVLGSPQTTTDRETASTIYRTVGESGVLKISNIGVRQ